jgi:glucokinase
MDLTLRTAGVDIGGTKVASAVLDGDQLSDVAHEPTAADEPAALIAQIVRIVGALGPVDAVGIGVPSVVRLSDGMVLSSANLASFRDVRLRDELQERLGVPVHVDNDANVAAVSSVWDQHLRLRYRSLANVTVGTGVGCGIAIDGRPLHGSRTSAVELGHLIVAADLKDGAPAATPTAPAARPDPRLPGAHPDSLEHWASGSALDRLAVEQGFADGVAVTTAGLAGDATAVEILRVLGERLGVGIAALITLLEPEAVVIAGGVSAAGELLVGPARAAARRLLLPGLGEQTEIRVSGHGPHAGVRGAALIARLEEHPS